MERMDLVHKSYQGVARETIIKSLVAFVERASKENATPAEIVALANVARVLLECGFSHSYIGRGN